jgi:hypothetical protein
MDPASVRRFELVALVQKTEWCRARDNVPGWSPYRSLSRDWFLAELRKVKAQHGEYEAESYERWRLDHLPIWAALAAGMIPTPGSKKIVGRRPNLP